MLSAPIFLRYCTTEWLSPNRFSAIRRGVSPYPPCVRALISAPLDIKNSTTSVFPAATPWCKTCQPLSSLSVKTSEPCSSNSNCNSTSFPLLAAIWASGGRISGGYFENTVRHFCFMLSVLCQHACHLPVSTL